jgi:predicted dehydrogenase
MTEKITRRTFTKAGAAATLGLAASRPARVRGANERIGLGFIGVGGRGRSLVNTFRACADAEIVALCDVYGPHVELAQKPLEDKAAEYGDFRRLIDRKDVDAVVIATPDHWHAVQTITACEAGKDVYCEKPVSMTVREGRRMVEAARRTEQIVQIGTQRRSSPAFIRLAELVTSGKIGTVTVSRTYLLKNHYPSGIGRKPPVDAPEGLDWEMWLGPRPLRPYQENITPYFFRYWKQYSSQIANMGSHYFDVIRWCLGELAPASVCALGGRFAVDDDRTIPDTMEAVFELPSGGLMTFGQYEACKNPVLRRGAIELRGSDGTLSIDNLGSFAVEPERGGQFQKPGPRMEPIEIKEGDKQMDAHHTRNFLDCVKSRRLPSADVEIGHRSTTFALLANISLATRSRIEWDAEREEIVSPREPNALLDYEYREPWKQP